MKQTVQKKPKVLRTLVRLIKSDGKKVLSDGQKSVLDEKVNKLPRRS